MTASNGWDLTDSAVQEAKQDLQNPAYQALREMERLQEKVDRQGWNSQPGHVLMNLMVVQVGRLLTEMACLREDVDRITSSAGWKKPSTSHAPLDGQLSMPDRDCAPTTPTSSMTET